MVKSIFHRLTRWTGVDRFRTRARQFMSWPGSDFDRVSVGIGGIYRGAGRSTVAVRSAVPAAPATYEMRFMRLHTEGRFEEMWEMLAEDAQRAWGGLQTFAREMPRLDEWMEILDMQVANVTMLEEWTDHLHARTYSNVARLLMRYRVRQQWKEWTFDRQVHLVPQANEWRTLCYPTRPGIAASR
jgi:hypothetical protein